MRLADLGRWLFAIGIIGIGALCLLHGNLAMQWQPIPAAVPMHPQIGYLTGLILVVCGLGLFLRRTAAFAAPVLVFAWLILFILPVVVGLVDGYKSVAGWLPIAEDGTMLVGAALIAANVITPGSLFDLPFFTGDLSLTVTRLGFGIACLIFGLSHFVYADFTAGMIPGFVPAHLPFAYITGAGHTLTGLAILSGIGSRLAATCEAIMMSLFVLLVHIPMVIVPLKPEAVQETWTLLFVAMTLSASAWSLAANLSDKPWGLKRG